MSTRREQILQMAGKLAEEPAQMPGPDGPVDIIVREMTGSQSQTFEMSVARGLENVLGYLLQNVIVDPDSHELMFDAGDRAALQELGMAALKPIVEIAQRQSGLSVKDLEQAKRNLLKAPAAV